MFADVLSPTTQGIFYLIALITFAVAAIVVFARDRTSLAIGLLSIGFAAIAFVSTWNAFALA